MLDKIINSIAPLTQNVEFPRADTRIVFTKGNVPHNDFLAIEVNMTDWGKEQVNQFANSFDRTFRRHPDGQTKALTITYEMPFIEVSVVLYVSQEVLDA